MFVAGLALSATTAIFSALVPFLIASLGALLGFAIPRAIKIPKYIKTLFLLYENSDPSSQTRKYVTGAALILSSQLAFMAHSFVPFTGVPIIGAVTTPIALLFSLVIILVALDIVTGINEPYLKNLEFVYHNEFQEMKDDLSTIRNIMGPSWNKLREKVKKIFDDLAPQLAGLCKEISIEINKYFSSHLSDLVVYLDRKNSSKIILRESEIKIIAGSLEPWKKVGGSLALGALAGAGSGAGVASAATAAFAPVTWWTPFAPKIVQAVLLGGRTVVGTTAFAAYTVVAPIALGLTIGTTVFSATMFAMGKIEEKNLSQFLADVIIASLPMIKVDGEFSEEEKQAIQQLLSNPKISEYDKARVNASLLSQDTFEDIIAKNIVYEKKAEKALIKNRLILTITWEIAKADGKIDDREVLLHNRMAKILQVPQETIDEVRCLVTPKFKTKML
jgi:uncharacterized tellurite resistance protein B-like protein